MGKGKIIVITIVVIFLLLIFMSLIKKRGDNAGPSVSVDDDSPSVSTGTTEYVLGPGNYDYSFIHDRETRTYEVHVPSSYDKNKKTPVVLALHGGGGNSEDSPRFFQIEGKARQENFIVVYPQGTGSIDSITGKVKGEWDVGIPEKSVSADDVGYFSKMIDELGTNFNVDEKRIHATGHSQGSMMSHRLACELSDKIASIAVGGAHGTKYPPCNPSRPVAIMHFHGLLDPCSPTNGGICGCTHFFPDDGWSCRSLNDFMDDWKDINGCKGNSEKVYERGTAECNSFTQCDGGVEVKLCTIGNMGHTWPGNDLGVDICNNPNSLLCQPWKKLVGPTSNDIQGNDMIWEFFEKHTM